jgi:hypothetical protein
MKRLAKILLLIITLFVFSGIVVSGADEFVETGSAGYRVVERLETNELLFDVLHYKDLGQSKRDGLFYRQEVNVLEVPATSNAKIVSYGNLSGHKWTLTTVSNLAKQFEAENPEWKVLAAVNGDFFDISGNGNLPYQTNNPLVTNGEYYKTNGSNAVGFKNDGSTNSLVGGKPTKTKYMILAVYDENDDIIAEFDIHKLNDTPGVGETAVYFGTYGSDKKYVPKAVDEQGNRFVVQNASLALPNNTNDFYGKGVISSTEPTTLQIGQFAVLSNNPDVLAVLKVGTKIRVQYEFTGDFAGVGNITGQNAKFLDKGEYSPHPSSSNNTYARHPRTVAGIKADGTVVLAVIDGRAPSFRDGMYGNEMAAFMKSIGAVEAYNLDGGGSSAMIVKENGQFVVKNSPSDGAERRDSNALLVAVQVPLVEVNATSTANSLQFDVNLVKANGFDLNEVFIKIDDVTNKIVDGKVEFTNLEPNQSYYYELIYKDNNNKLMPIFVDGNVKTLKYTPEFKYIKIVEDDITYKISLEYDDHHNASNLKNAKIIVNGTTKTLADNQLIYMKSSWNDVFVRFDLIYSYNDNLKTYNVVIENAPYRIVTSSVTEALYEMFRIHNNKILNFYK